MARPDELKEAGLDYYNHNLDTDASFYGQVITTHKHADRIDTLGQVREAGIKVCSGGIIGMGESRRNRAALIVQLANLNPPPESVPINNLVPIPGTPLADVAPIDSFEFVRTIAAARITMPASFVRLSAGRQAMSEELQALCFLAGANSIFYGDKLLTTGNPKPIATKRCSRSSGCGRSRSQSSMKAPAQFVDQRQVRRNFARAASTYDEVAVCSAKSAVACSNGSTTCASSRSACSISVAAPAPVSPRCRNVIPKRP
jgi:biotin synthase-like enzyme